MKKTKCIKKKSICVKLKTKCIKKKNKKKCVKKTICAKRKTKCVKRHKKTHKRYSGLPVKIRGNVTLPNIGPVFGLFNISDKKNTNATTTHSNNTEAINIRLKTIKFKRTFETFAKNNADIVKTWNRTDDYTINTKIKGHLIEEIKKYIQEGRAIRRDFNRLNAIQGNPSVQIANLLDCLRGFLLHIDCALSTFYFTSSYQNPETGERPGKNLLRKWLGIKDSHINNLPLITYIIDQSGPNGGNLDYDEINNITDKMIEEVGTLKIQEGLNVIFPDDTFNFSQDIIDFIYNFKQRVLPHRIIGSDNSVRQFLQDRGSALQLGSMVDDDDSPPPYNDDDPPPPYDDDYYTHPSYDDDYYTPPSY